MTQPSKETRQYVEVIIGKPGADQLRDRSSVDGPHATAHLAPLPRNADSLSSPVIVNPELLDQPVRLEPRQQPGDVVLRKQCALDQVVWPQAALARFGKLMQHVVPGKRR